MKTNYTYGCKKWCVIIHVKYFDIHRPKVHIWNQALVACHHNQLNRNEDIIYPIISKRYQGADTGGERKSKQVKHIGLLLVNRIVHYKRFVPLCFIRFDFSLPYLSSCPCIYGMTSHFTMIKRDKFAKNKKSI